MTSEATAVVRRFFELAAAGDYDGMPEIIDTEAIWLGTRGGLDEEQVVRGPDAWIRYMREIDETWERSDVSVERLVEIGDSVVAFLRERAHARHGDLEVQNETAVVIKVRHQKIVEARGYLDRDEALRAATAGLES